MRPLEAYPLPSVAPEARCRTHHVACWEPSSRRPCSPVSPRSRVIASPQASTAGSRAACLEDADAGLDDLDLRGRLLPTAAQTSAASSLGGLVRWNRFGTPASISKPEATWAGLVEQRGHRGARLAGLPCRPVRPDPRPDRQSRPGQQPAPGRQRRPRGALPPGLRRPLPRDRQHGDRRCRRRRDPVRLLLARPLDGDLGAGRDALGDRRLAEGGRRRRPGGEQHQDLARSRPGWAGPGSRSPASPRTSCPGCARSRWRTAPCARSSRPTSSTPQGGSATAYTSLVDAVTGKVLVRHNQVDHANDVVPVPGHRHRHRLRAQAPVRGQGRQQQVHRRHRGRGRHHQRHRGQDLRPRRRPARPPATPRPAPRWRRTAPTRSRRASTRCRSARSRTRPCRSPRRATTPPPSSPPTRAPPPAAAPCRTRRSGTTSWPTRRSTTRRPPTPTNRVTGCWVTSNQGTRVPGCDTPPGALENFAARAPWDVDVRTGLPTFTTVGNAANTHEAWVSPLTPGGTAQAPVSPTRAYDDAFTDAWNNSKCDPTQLHPGGNDINAVGDEPVRRAQPDARLVVLRSASPRRTTTCRAATSATATRAARTTRSWATPRPAPSPVAHRRTWVATTPTRSRCRTVSRASPTSTSSSRSPVRSTRPASTARST